MVNMLVPDLIPILQPPGLMPGMEKECQKLLQLFWDILPALPRAELGWHIVELGGYIHAVELDPGQIEDIFPVARVARVGLADLNAAAYEVDDIVDEFRYATLRAEAEADRHQSAGHKLVRTSIFSLICKLITSSKRQIPFEGGMKKRLKEILIRMGVLVERSTDHINSRQGQGLMPSAAGWQDLNLSSLKKIDPIIVGRDDEKEQVVNHLLDLRHTVQDAIALVAIVGFNGINGIGKTTFARFICGDTRIKNHFEIILWVNVGVEFNVPKIAKSMIDQVIGKDCCLSEGDTDLLGRRICQELSGKSYLLVLDDFNFLPYNKEKWEQLKSWLNQSAATGSSLIVMMRDNQLVLHRSLFSFLREFVTLEISPLRTNDLWTFFCKRAFIANKEISPEVHEIRKHLLKICRGSPLLVNLMGSLIRFRKEPAEWEEVIYQLKKYLITWTKRCW